MMSQLGLSENNTEHFKGRIIKEALIRDDHLVMDFKDGSRVSIEDNGQSCCEHRYMSTNDDLAMLTGAMLHDIEAVKHEEMYGEYGDEHEMLFIAIKTQNGTLTLVFHNEHNGYYGGFGMNLVELLAPNPSEEERCLRIK